MKKFMMEQQTVLRHCVKPAFIIFYFIKTTLVSGVAFSVAEPVRFSPAQDFFRRLRLQLL